MPPAKNPHTGPRITPERMTMASPGWMYPPVPGVGIRMDMVATQESAANKAARINFFRLLFIVKVPLFFQFFTEHFVKQNL